MENPETTVNLRIKHHKAYKEEEEEEDQVDQEGQEESCQVLHHRE